MIEGATRIAEGLTRQVRARHAVELDDLDAMATRLVLAAAMWKRSRENALKAACHLIEDDARAQIGHYQPQVGEYPEWEPLAESTEIEKARIGAPPDAPLLRYGELQESFTHEVSGDEGIVGSTDPVMLYHEFGTPRMPARPVVGPAVFKNRDAIGDLLGRAIVTGVFGGEIADPDREGERAYHFIEEVG